MGGGYGSHSRHARIPEVSGTRPADLGIDGGRIVVIAPHLTAEAREIDVKGCLVAPGLIETHIHLDKSCILDRCKAEQGDLEEAIGEVARAKTAFTPRTSTRAASGPSSNASCNGTTHMRTQLEVDPGIGLRGLQGVRPLIDEYKWAIDIEILHLPPGRIAEQPRDRRTDGRGPQDGRQRGGCRALHRH